MPKAKDKISQETLWQLSLDLGRMNKLKKPVRFN
jgi:hypothetical protein